MEGTIDWQRTYNLKGKQHQLQICQKHGYPKVYIMVRFYVQVDDLLEIKVVGEHDIMTLSSYDERQLYRRLRSLQGTHMVTMTCQTFLDSNARLIPEPLLRQFYYDSTNFLYRLCFKIEVYLTHILRFRTEIFNTYPMFAILKCSTYLIYSTYLTSILLPKKFKS